MNTLQSNNPYNLEILPPYTFPLNSYLNYGIDGNTVAINPLTSQKQATKGGATVLRCAIYARVSTTLDAQKTSIDNQIDIFNRYASERGWEITKIYTDKKTATKNNRPGFKQLVEDTQKGIFDIVLAKELSRLARNGALSYAFRDTCQTNKVHIICLDNSINTLEGNIENFGLFAWLYENESANNSRRNKQAKGEKAKKGLFVGSNAPFGYRSDKGILKIRDDETPDIVRRIYSEYLEGKGMDTIAKMLTAERVITPSQAAGKSNASILWHASTIKQILNNQHYCGDLVQNKSQTISVTTTKRNTIDKENMIVHKDIHEAIISRETFQTVQQMMQNRTRTTTAPKKHLFTNILYCEDCSKGMWFKANQKGYRCGGNIKHGDTFCLNKTVVREKELAHIIQEDLQILFQSFQDEIYMKSLLDKLNSKKRQLQNDLLKVETRINTQRQNKLNYVNLYTENIITKEDLMDFKELTETNIKELEVSKAQLLEKIKECSEKNYSIELANKLEEFLSLKELTPQVLHSLVEKVTCNIDGNIRITYNFVNPFQET